MKRLFTLFSLLFFAGTFLVAQEIPVEKQGKNSYSFKVPDYITVQDFEFVSAVTTNNPDVYIINVRALDADKKTDTRVKGKLLFEINGESLPVDFVNGLGFVQATIKSTNTITMRAVDSNITRTGTINHGLGWVKIGGILLAVLVLGLVIWQVQRRKKRLN